LTKINND